MLHMRPCMKALTHRDCLRSVQMPLQTAQQPAIFLETISAIHCGRQICMRNLDGHTPQMKRQDTKQTNRLWQYCRLRHLMLKDHICRSARSRPAIQDGASTIIFVHSEENVYTATVISHIQTSRSSSQGAHNSCTRTSFPARKAAPIAATITSPTQEDAGEAGSPTQLHTALPQADQLYAHKAATVLTQRMLGRPGRPRSRTPPGRSGSARSDGS